MDLRFGKLLPGALFFQPPDHSIGNGNQYAMSLSVIGDDTFIALHNQNPTNSFTRFIPVNLSGLDTNSTYPENQRMQSVTLRNDVGSRYSVQVERHGAIRGRLTSKEASPTSWSDSLEVNDLKKARIAEHELPFVLDAAEMNKRSVGAEYSWVG